MLLLLPACLTWTLCSHMGNMLSHLNLHCCHWGSCPLHRAWRAWGKARFQCLPVMQEFPGAEVAFGDVTDVEDIKRTAFGRPIDVVVSCLASRTGGKVRLSWWSYANKAARHPGMTSYVCQAAPPAALALAMLRYVTAQVSNTAIGSFAHGFLAEGLVGHRLPGDAQRAAGGAAERRSPLRAAVGHLRPETAAGVPARQAQVRGRAAGKHAMRFDLCARCLCSARRIQVVLTSTACHPHIGSSGNVL